jgi:hypothetical protein
VDAAIERFRHLGIDLPAEPGQAAEGRLDMAARTAKAVVKVEMAKGGIEIVKPHQAHDTPAKPDTFRISGRPIQRLRRLDEFVGLALVILVGVGGICRGGFSGLVLGVIIAALGEGASDTDQEGKSGDREMAQNRILKLNHTSTHKFPGCCSPAPATPRAGLMPLK